MEQSILMTGLNGFMGSVLATEQIKNGNIIWYLTKSKEDWQSAYSRIERILIKQKEIIDLSTSFRWLSYSSLKDQSELKTLMKGHYFNEVWHLAAEMSYDNRDFQKVMDFNSVSSTALMKSVSHCGRFFYISSIGIAGSGNDLEPITLKEELLDTFVPMNPYTVSKVLGEYMLWNLSKKLNLPLTILRPASIIGDSITGWAPNTNHGYYSYLYILNRFMNKGITFYLDIHPDHPYPVIHLDHLLEVCTQLQRRKDELKKSQEIFHIVNRGLFTPREHFQIFEEVCKGSIKIEYGAGERSFNKHFNRINYDNNRFMENKNTFSNKELIKAIGAYNLPLNLTKESIFKVIEYYLRGGDRYFRKNHSN